jgi:CubicO group peptidase (beta-lactamase class C family)
MPATSSLPPGLGSRLAASAVCFGIPGLAIALAAPGRQSLFLHGEQPAGSGQPVDEATWFSVASLGKHVTAATLLDLAAQGRLDLTAEIGRLLPDVPPAWADRSVASLLHHTSGLPEYLALALDAVPTQRCDFMAAYAGLAPAFGEGQGWLYTNTNYILAGFLIAQAAGRPYAAAVQAMFDRAGVRGAAVGTPGWATRAHGDAAPDAESAAREVIGDGDACFTPTGALAWLQALLDSPAFDEALRRQISSPGALASGRPSLYGAGWFLEPLRDGWLMHHAGHFDGWTAMAILDPASRSGVIAMCNLAPGNTRAIRHLAQQALEGYAPGSTPLSLPPIEDRAPALTAAALAQLIRRPGEELDAERFADELKNVAQHGGSVRRMPNLWAGVEPERVELVSELGAPTHRLRRHRLVYADRTEHLLAGFTPEGRLYWAWVL